MTGPTARDELRHGVGIVDKMGPQCICEADFPFASGGWTAFNEHLDERFAAARSEAPGELDAEREAHQAGRITVLDALASAPRADRLALIDEWLAQAREVRQDRLREARS